MWSYTAPWRTFLNYRQKSSDPAKDKAVKEKLIKAIFYRMMMVFVTPVDQL